MVRLIKPVLQLKIKKNSFMGPVTSKQKLVTRSVKKFFLTSSLVSRYKGEDRRIERRRPSMERKKA